MSALFTSNQRLSAADLPKCAGSPQIFWLLKKHPHCSKVGWDKCRGEVRLSGWNGIEYEGIWENGELSNGTITYNRNDKRKRSVTGRWKNTCRTIEDEIYVINFFHPRSVGGMKQYRGQINRKTHSSSRFHGKGTLTYSNGKVDDGYFKNGEYMGSKPYASGQNKNNSDLKTANVSYSVLQEQFRPFSKSQKIFS